MSASIDLLFSRRRHVGSAFIRLATWSSWSHVDVVWPERVGWANVVVGATGAHGVSCTGLAERMAQSSRAVRLRADLPSESHRDRLLWWLHLQLDKPYDWTAVFGIGLRRDWQQDDKWFCSELVAAAFAHVGMPLVRLDQWRITPQDLAQSPLLRPVL
jgi:uncharacterized protein YycO